jgi:2,4-dienoyl-CoA reductase-like NADH-dependent reductase (Old Yellow Enzyme family)
VLDVSPTTSVAALFRPFSVGTLTVPNRFVMAPMTREFSPGGVPGEDVAAYYARRARHGVGLIVTEGTVVDHPASASSDTVPRFHGDAALDGWARVVREVHAAGGRIIPQLWHVGADRKPGEDPAPGKVSPSGVDVLGDPAGEPLTESGIAAVVDSFARAAGHAKRLGFDGLELHGGHGYLIDQFLWPATNRRTDRYGGSAAARATFAAEVVAACRAATGPGFPIFFRLSQWKIPVFDARLAQNPDELAQYLEPLVRAGVDVFHCSTRRFWLPEFEGSDLTFAGWVRKLSGLPTVAVGSVGLDNSEFMTAFLGAGAGNASLTELLRRLQRGEFDLVAVGRLLAADPEWVAKIRDGRTAELAPFSPETLTRLV